MASGQARNSPAVWSFRCYYMACTFAAIWHLTLFIFVSWPSGFCSLILCIWNFVVKFLFMISIIGLHLNDCILLHAGLPGIDSHVWLHGRFDMVPWTHLREPIFENVDERNPELTHFNLLIRLSIVKQSALPFITFFAMSPRSRCPSCTWELSPSLTRD